jgi:hypothetical protein
MMDRLDRSLADALECVQPELPPGYVKERYPAAMPA